MSLRNTTATWGLVARVLHWLSAVLIVGMMVAGSLMTDMSDSPDKFRLYAVHKATGITLLALIVCRIAWRLANPTPAAPPGMPAWQRFGASAAHLALYAVMLGMALSGWVLNSAADFPLHWFGLFEVPAITGPDEALQDLATSVHGLLFYALGTLLALHVGAALRHQFVRRDGLITRMWSGRT